MVRVIGERGFYPKLFFCCFKSLLLPLSINYPIMNYQLTKSLGNNTFSYDQRKQLGSDWALMISQPCEISSLNQVQLGNFAVFEEVDHNGKLHSCTGLSHTYILKLDKLRHPPIIITDNHNHVLPYWLDYISKCKIPAEFMSLHDISPFSEWPQCSIKVEEFDMRLIHIDQHTDLWTNPHKLDHTQISDPQYQWDFAHLECDIGNFITPCIESWLITNMIQVRTEYKLNEILKEQEIKIIQKYKSSSFHFSPLILDIDLDFWAPEMWISDIQKTMSQVRSIMGRADLITIATSPYFINQNLALELLHQLLWPYLEFKNQKS